jgi:hypothetical protein
MKIVGALGVVVASIAATNAAAVAAGPPVREVSVDSWDFVDDNLCGLQVQVKGERTEQLLINGRGRDGIAYFGVRARGSDSFTNLANGKTYSGRWVVNDKDLKVTDNGDGTLTILGLATGNSQWFDADGKLLFADPGQIRYELLIDHGGTPADPEDDTFLEDLGVVKGSTGRNDLQGRDFCEDLHLVVD